MTKKNSHIQIDLERLYKTRKYLQ